jgi:hypothetical protein
MPAFRPRPQPRRRLPAVLTGAAMIVLMVAGALTARWIVGPRQQPHASSEVADKQPESEKGSAAVEPEKPDGAADLVRGEPLEPPAWLPKTPPHADFDLRVTMLGSRKDSAGRHLLKEGEKVVFHIRVARTAYVGIWTLDDDRSITQVFPNKYEIDRRVPANTVRTIPNPEVSVEDEDYVLEATVSRDTEWVWVVASTEPWDEMKGEQEGPFYVFKSAEARRRGQQHLRGIVPKLVKGGKAAVAEKLLPFKVSAQSGSRR